MQCRDMYVTKLRITAEVPSHWKLPLGTNVTSHILDWNLSANAVKIMHGVNYLKTAANVPLKNILYKRTGICYSDWNPSK